MSFHLKNFTKKIVINGYKIKLDKEKRCKSAKKGVLVKIIDSYSQKTKVLTDILNESENLNIVCNSDYLNNCKFSNETRQDELLKKYRNMPKGGPKHSIAVNRAHHLSNFLSKFIINGFQSDFFKKPDIPVSLNKKYDTNGFVKEIYSFELSDVELQANLSFLRIYWLCSDDEEINRFVEDYLDKSLKSQIRNKLISERFMSYVPQVLFIRDNRKLLLKKIDEDLMKIKLGTQINEEEVVFQESNESNENDSKRKFNKISNVYGVDIDNLSQSINQNYLSTNKKEPLETLNKKNANEAEITNQKTNLDKLQSFLNQSSYINEKNNFLGFIKAYQINTRIKSEKRSKSVLNKLNQLEYEKFKSEEII